MMKKTLSILSANRWTILTLVFAICLVTASYMFGTDTQKVEAQSTTEVAGSFTGWAWSDNIGWISLSSANTGAGTGVYSVDVLDDGTLSGWAWSDNIGWIAFSSDRLSGCPIAGTCYAKITPTTGVVTGWARACAGTTGKDCKTASRDDGWDGWISLSGVATDSVQTPYGVTIRTNGTTGEFHPLSYAWGDNVVGWVNFKGTIKCNEGHSWSPTLLRCAAPTGCAVSPMPATTTDPVLGIKCCDTSKTYNSGSKTCEPGGGSGCILGHATTTGSISGSVLCCNGTSIDLTKTYYPGTGLCGPSGNSCDGAVSGATTTDSATGGVKCCLANENYNTATKQCKTSGSCDYPVAEIGGVQLCCSVPLVNGECPDSGAITDPLDPDAVYNNCSGVKPTNNVVRGANIKAASGPSLNWTYINTIGTPEACKWKCLASTATTTYRKINATGCAADTIQQD